MTPKTIPLSTDTTAADAAGLPKPLTPEGDVEFDTPANNPDETTDLPGYVDVDGVEEGGIDPKPTNKGK